MFTLTHVWGLVIAKWCDWRWRVWRQRLRMIELEMQAAKRAGHWGIDIAPRYLARTMEAARKLAYYEARVRPPRMRRVA